MPTAAEALARLDMPLLEAMMTQRAVRRVLPDPVDDAVVLKCIELALRAPTGNNGQNWEFIVVKDRRVKEKLAKRYRQAWKIYYGAMIRRVAARDESMAKIARAVQWQVDHFTEIPVLVVACLRLGAREGRRAVRADAPCRRSPATSDRSTPVCRTCYSPRAPWAWVRRLITLPLWSVTSARRDPQPATVRDSVLHRATRLAARALRADDPQTGRAGDAPRCLRQPRLARRLMRSSAATRGGRRCG